MTNAQVLLTMSINLLTKQVMRIMKTIKFFFPGSLLNSSASQQVLHQCGCLWRSWPFFSPCTFVMCKQRLNGWIFQHSVATNILGMCQGVLINVLIALVEDVCFRFQKLSLKQQLSIPILFCNIVLLCGNVVSVTKCH